MINNIINEIQRNETSFTFSGDGFGDFEKIDTTASQQTIEAYIEYCYEQIKLANEYLKTIEH